MTAETYGIPDDELVQKMVEFIPLLIRHARDTRRSEVTIYRFQNDEFDGKAWFHSGRTHQLNSAWLTDPAKRIYAHCTQLVTERVFTHLSLRYWYDSQESETGFYLVGHLPHTLGTR